MASPLTTKGHDNLDGSDATPTPNFFLFYDKQQPHQQPKGILVLRTKVKYISASITHDSSIMSTGSSLAKPHSFVWPLKRVPLLTAMWTKDRPTAPINYGLSIVCPSPRYQNFRPDTGLFLGLFLGSFWRVRLSNHYLSDFPAQRLAPGQRFHPLARHVSIRVEIILSSNLTNFLPDTLMQPTRGWLAVLFGFCYVMRNFGTYFTGT
jgi:hypothetical protein